MLTMAAFPPMTVELGHRVIKITAYFMLKD
jgi:hypothetical protein